MLQSYRMTTQNCDACQFGNRLSNCLLYTTVSHSVSSCAHFVIHH